MLNDEVETDKATVSTRQAFLVKYYREFRLQVAKHPVSVGGLSSPTEEIPPDRGGGLNPQDPRFKHEALSGGDDKISAALPEYHPPI